MARWRTGPSGCRGYGKSCPWQVERKCRDLSGAVRGSAGEREVRGRDFEHYSDSRTVGWQSRLEACNPPGDGSGRSPASRDRSDGSAKEPALDLAPVSGRARNARVRNHSAQAVVLWCDATLMEKWGDQVPATRAQCEAPGGKVATRHLGYLVDSAGDTFAPGRCPWAGRRKAVAPAGGTGSSTKEASWAATVTPGPTAGRSVCSMVPSREERQPGVVAGPAVDVERSYPSCSRDGCAAKTWIAAPPSLPWARRSPAVRRVGPVIQVGKLFRRAESCQLTLMLELPLLW
jgi:hypothetical protein